MGTSATSHVCDEASLGETSFGEARMRGDQVVDNARIREGRGVAKCVRLEGGDLEAGGWVGGHGVFKGQMCRCSPAAFKIRR